MKEAARFLIRAVRGLLLVLAALALIVALTLAITREHLLDIPGYIQIAAADAAWAFAIGFMVPERGRAAAAGHRNIGRARKLLLALLLIEIATCVCFFVVYLTLNQSLPAVGMRLTLGFPYWGSIFGVDSTGAGVYLDIPLLVAVLFLYTLDEDALDDKADNAA